MSAVQPNCDLRESDPDKEEVSSPHSDPGGPSPRSLMNSKRVVHERGRGILSQVMVFNGFSFEMFWTKFEGLDIGSAASISVELDTEDELILWGGGLCDVYRVISSVGDFAYIHHTYTCVKF